MARPKRAFPVPSLKKINGSFKLRWYADGENYQLSLGQIHSDVAARICIATAASLAGNEDFPECIQTDPVVVRYLRKQNNILDGVGDQELVDLYVKHMKTIFRSTWPNSVRYHLLHALSHLKSIQRVTPQKMNEYLDSVAGEWSNATRNRRHTALSGFFRWMRANGYVDQSFDPLRNTKLANEKRDGVNIVIWEKNEIKRLLRAADARKDGVAVWIAILAGLRRSEIAHLKWKDITQSYIVVNRSKTGMRNVPLSNLLARQLEKCRKTGEKVVPWPHAHYGWLQAARRLTEKYLPKLLPKLYQKHPEKFGWNAFRHTFASRHAQNGLSLDIISAWMGNSPQVCKDHYARYVPENYRDSRVDAADPKL